MLALLWIKSVLTSKCRVKAYMMRDRHFYEGRPCVCTTNEPLTFHYRPYTATHSHIHSRIEWMLKVAKGYKTPVLVELKNNMILGVITRLDDCHHHIVVRSVDGEILFDSEGHMKEGN